MRAAAEPTMARASLAALLAILLLSGGACADAAEQDVTGIVINAKLSAAEIQQVVTEVRRIDVTPILAIVDASTLGRVGVDTEGTHLVVMVGNAEPAEDPKEFDTPESPETPETPENPATPDAGFPTIHIPTIHILERQGEQWIVIKTTKMDC